MRKQFCSVIIPFYNAETTIERTIFSLLSNKEYIREVIFVDDASTDSSVARIEEYKDLFPRVRILTNDKNSGPGISRQLGLDNAIGDWVTFSDADDCITPSALQYVYEAIEKRTSALSVVYAKTMYSEFGNFDKDTIEYSDGSCGGSFYKRDFLMSNELFFSDKLRTNEDEFFNNKIRFYAENYLERDLVITHLNYPTYHVFHDNGRKSLTFSNWFNYFCQDRLLSTQYFIEHFIIDEKLKERLKSIYIENFISTYFLVQSLLFNNEKTASTEGVKICFNMSLDFAKKTFEIEKKDLVSFYYNNIDDVNVLKNSAIASGGEFLEKESFNTFLQNLD